MTHIYFRVFEYFIRVLLLVSKSIIMKALLAAEGRLKGINEEQLDKFVMVERWRKVGKIETMMKIVMPVYCKYGRGCRKYASLACFDPHCWVFAKFAKFHRHCFFCRFYKYVLLQVERPLKRESCLLKIWQAWGPEAQDVQFILKRVSSKASSRRACKVRVQYLKPSRMMSRSRVAELGSLSS